MNQTTDTQLTPDDDGKPPIPNTTSSSTGRTAKGLLSLQGMGKFSFIWFSQLFSILGSRLTSFALGIWVYEQTLSVTQFALPILSATIPSIIIGPIAGIYVDRWSRRWTMIVSDLGAGLCTLLIAWLYIRGNLELWHICLTNIMRACFDTFQDLAYTASTTLLVPKENLTRASAMVQTGQAISNLVAPSLATALLGIIQFQGIIAIDLITLLFALLALYLVRFAEFFDITNKPKTEQKSFREELTFGWSYCKQRPGLLWLILLITMCNFLVGATEVLEVPLILSFASVMTLGIIMSCANLGMVVGGLIITIWGNIQNQMITVFISMFSIGLSVLIAGLRPFAILLAVASFSWLLAVSVLNSVILAIYQRKVAPEVQGRVFAFLKSISLAALPISFLLAAPLADRIFEPLMNQDGWVARSIGQVIGTGPGRGIGLMFICMGALTILMTSVAYFSPRLRYLEEELPDAIADAE